MTKLNKLIIFFFFQLLPFASEATWNEYFEKLKHIPRSYEDIGGICEALAQINFEMKYPAPQFFVDSGVEYKDSENTAGELDILVLDLNTNKVIHIAEVKCWKNLQQAQQKAVSQRNRFIKYLKSGHQIYFEGANSGRFYSKDQFSEIFLKTSVAQKGSVAFGFDEELEFDFKELRRFGMEMLRCQDRGECVKP